jgi:hypothetical protein
MSLSSTVPSTGIDLTNTKIIKVILVSFLNEFDISLQYTPLEQDMYLLQTEERVISENHLSDISLYTSFLRFYIFKG